MVTPENQLKEQHIYQCPCGSIEFAAIGDDWYRCRECDREWHIGEDQLETMRFNGD